MELIIVGAVVYILSEKVFNVSKIPRPNFKKNHVDEYRDDNDLNFNAYPANSDPAIIPRYYGDENLTRYPIKEFQPVFYDNDYLYGNEPSSLDTGYFENMSIINSTRKQ
jgi:hypothetical protein